MQSSVLRSFLRYHAFFVSNARIRKSVSSTNQSPNDCNVFTLLFSPNQRKNLDNINCGVFLIKADILCYLVSICSIVTIEWTRLFLNFSTSWMSSSWNCLVFRRFLIPLAFDVDYHQTFELMSFCLVISFVRLSQFGDRFRCTTLKTNFQS